MSNPTLHTRANLNFDEASALTDRIRTTTESLWSLLLEAHERKAWTALGYDTWQGYVETEFGMHRRTSYKLLDQARVIAAIGEAAGVCPIGHIDISEYAARELKPVLPALTDEIRTRIEQGEKPAEAVRAVVKAKREERKTAPPVQMAKPDVDPETGTTAEDVEPDPWEELKHERREVARLEAQVAALSATDQGAEVLKWTTMYAQLEGRLRQEMANGNEARRQATRQGATLKKIREALGVERDSEIIAALRTQLAA